MARAGGTGIKGFLRGPRGPKNYSTIPLKSHNEEQLQEKTSFMHHNITCGSAIAEDSRFEGPVTVNWQFESGSPLLPSYEQLPPVPLFSKDIYICPSIHQISFCPTCLS